MPKFMKRRRTKRTFAKKRRPLRKGPKRPALKRMIRREIARNVEDKTLQSYIYSRNLFGPAAGSTDFLSNNMIVLGPSASGLVINQGVTQGTRIGNRIKTKRLMFKGTFVPNAYNLSTNPVPKPLHVKMWILYDKINPTTVPNPPTAADFFQNGASTKGFQDDLTDLWSPINTDRYRVLTVRQFKLGASSSVANGTFNLANNYFANNDFKLNCSFRINLTKYYPKNVKFVDGSTSPSTRGLYCMVTLHAADGGPIGGIDLQANMQWMQDYKFEDA